MYKLWTSQSSSTTRLLGLNQIRLITWAIVGALGKQRKTVWRLEWAGQPWFPRGCSGGGEEAARALWEAETDPGSCLHFSAGTRSHLILTHPQTPSQGHSYYHTTFLLLNYLAQGPIASK